MIRIILNVTSLLLATFSLTLAGTPPISIEVNKYEFTGYGVGCEL